MLSDLALVDWIALIVALFILGVAGVAAYLTWLSDSAQATVVDHPQHAAPAPQHGAAESPRGQQAAPTLSSVDLAGPPVSVGRSTNPDEIIDLTSDREETVAERAARLRS